MINIAKDTVFNLKPINVSLVRKEVSVLLIENEEIIAAFKTVRDQFIFTNKRIITIDVQGITGVRKSYSSLPYSRIQFFSIQTPGIMELVPDSELMITFANGYTARFEFAGNTNILELSNILAQYIL